MIDTVQTIDLGSSLQSIRRVIVAGWTGRDPDAVQTHIRELELLGVEPPSAVPSFYRVSRDRVTLAGRIEVSGQDTSGEVEFVLARAGGELIVGVGSDHTDRNLETINVSKSKQICEKVIAPGFWKYSDIKSHWDQLVLRSWIYENNQRALYQEGHVSHMLSVETLLERFEKALGNTLQTTDLVFGGTLSAIGGIRGSKTFEFELEDPVLSRKIGHSYEIDVLPI